MSVIVRTMLGGADVLKTSAPMVTDHGDGCTNFSQGQLEDCVCLYSQASTNNWTILLCFVFLLARWPNWSITHSFYINQPKTSSQILSGRFKGPIKEQPTSLQSLTQKPMQTSRLHRLPRIHRYIDLSINGNSWWKKVRWSSTAVPTALCLFKVSFWDPCW